VGGDAVPLASIGGPSKTDEQAASGWFIGRPLSWLVALDLAGVGFALAAFVQVADPDVLLHCVWIVLALEAFLFGGRVAVVRIVIATGLVVTYALIAEEEASPFAASMIDLELAEWPLMILISLLVAVMADRVTQTGRRYAALYRAASDRLLTAQEDERRRLAADLHDGVGQTMTALLLTLDAAEAMLWSDEHPSRASRDAVLRSQELAAGAMEEVRGVAFRLRPARLAEVGLVAAIRELAASAGTPVAFDADARLVRTGLLGPDEETDAYRIVQEALGNASRHAHAAVISVQVRLNRSLLRIEVADEGVGFAGDSVAVRGLGLAGMRERAAAIGGRLTIDSSPGRGATVRLEVPLAPGVLAAIEQTPSGLQEAGALVP